MEEKILLRLHYIHREYVEIEVDDPDKCNILDLFVELLEGAEKIKMFLPGHPTLWYAHNGQSFQLETDSDVVNMFHLFSEKKLINLAIGTDDSPSKNLDLARGLFDSKRQLVAPQRSSHGNLPTSNRRVPPTSARRREKCVVKDGAASLSLGSEPTSGDVSRTKDDVAMSILPSAEIPSDFVSFGVDVPSTSVLDMYMSSDDEKSDEICDSESESDYFDRIYENGEMYADTDFEKIKLKAWMLFCDKESLLNVVRDYCVQEGFVVVVSKTDHIRYTAMCGDSSCNWRIHASSLSDGKTWAIKTLDSNHSCLKVGQYNSMATPAWASTKILEYIRADEEVKGKTVQTFLFEKFGIHLKSTSLYKSIALAKKIINGSEDTSYGSLPGYCEVLKTSNPGSKAHVVWKHPENDPEKPIQFKNVFISLKPMIDGFIHGCRGLIGVDGCHLKGKYGGVVLEAVGMDGNNEIFPLVYGVYENESKRTWSSFFFHLRELLSNSERDNWCIVSDRQKGVEPALAKVWPTASRRYCATHLCANFKKAFPGKPTNDVFWACCKAFSESKFKKAMEKVESTVGLGGVDWLKKLGDFECWARHKFDPSLHSPEPTSNFVESFNSTLGADRCLPVLSLLEGIRRTTMVRHCMRQEAARKLSEDDITDYAKKKLEKARADARALQLFKASPSEFEVTEGRSSLPVNIENRICACGEWQIRGIPCRHAVRAILEMRAHPEHYVSAWYSVRFYKRTYSVNYKAVMDEEQWPEFDLPKISPPSMKRGVGRPPRTRRRQEGQQEPGKRSGIVACGRCKAFGHNRKTCKGGPTARKLREQGIRVERRQKGRKTSSSAQDTDVMSSAPWLPESQ